MTGLKRWTDSCSRSEGDGSSDAGYILGLRFYLMKEYADHREIAEIKSEADLFGPGAAPGTVPTDLEQAVGLERLEILGKMQGVDVFDMKPLDSSRKGMSRHYYWIYITDSV